MKNDARKLSTEEQHLIRQLAVQRVLDGESAAEVTRYFGFGKTTIFTWLRTARAKGMESLCPKVRTGGIVLYQNVKNSKLNAGL